LIFGFVSYFSTGHLTVDIRISDFLLSSACPVRCACHVGCVVCYPIVVFHYLTGVSICVNPCLIFLCVLGSLWLKLNQSKITNYAKQTQFPKHQKCFNLSKDNELQRTMNHELLFKTNPIKPNFKRRRR